MIMQWIVLAFVVVLLILFFLQVEHHTKTIKIFLIIIIGAILYFSLVGLLSSSQVDLTSPKGIINGAYLYAGWIGQIGSSLWNIGVETTHMVGNAIKINNTEETSNRRR
jgi:hypothetical protein